MALKLHEGVILSKDKVSEAWSANVIPSIFFYNFVKYPPCEFKTCYPFVGIPLACIFMLRRIWNRVFEIFCCKFQWFFTTKRKVSWTWKNFLYYIDMIMYHCIFFEVDPRPLNHHMVHSYRDWLLKGNCSHLEVPLGATESWKDIST